MAGLFFTRPARPDSPLPDTSILEAGLLEDDEPVSQPAEVYDEVRHLLRTSTFGSVASSPESTRRGRKYTAPPTPPDSPIARRPRPFELPTPPLTPTRPTPAVLAAPSGATTTAAPPMFQLDVPSAGTASAGQLFPPLRPMASSHPSQGQHSSAMFNTRAFAALHHPDLTDPSLEHFAQQKLQSQGNAIARGGTTKPKPKPASDRRRRRTHARRAALRLQSCVTVLSALLLSALVATYLGLMTNTTAASSVAFNVSFVLGMLGATILFAWSVIRLFMLAGRGRETQLRHRPLWTGATGDGTRVRHGARQGRHRHRRPRGHSQRHGRVDREGSEKASTDGPNAGEAFVPTQPIPVHVAADLRDITTAEDDPSRAESVVGEQEATKSNAEPPAPPAYGRWRGSVLANPALLHWQPLTTTPPADAATPPCASPTYEEAMREAMESVMSRGPPTYATRESPGPAAGRQASVETFEVQMAEAVKLELAGPEMVEIKADDVTPAQSR